MNSLGFSVYEIVSCTVFPDPHAAPPPLSHLIIVTNAVRMRLDTSGGNEHLPLVHHQGQGLMVAVGFARVPFIRLMESSLFLGG